MFLSQLLSAELDAIGFGKDIVSRRVEMYTKRSEAKVKASWKLLGCEHIDKVIVGSRREGVAMETSDTDILQINHGAFCSKDVEDFIDLEDAVCFLMDCDNAPPGYAFLSLYSQYSEGKSQYYRDLEKALVHRGNNIYLSSEKYLSLIGKQQMAKKRGWFERNTKSKERHGPAIPKVLDPLGIEADLVAAFPASCSDVLRAWTCRIRSNNWPNEDVVKRIADLPVYVVAVGEHGSENEDLQWRISFNQAEMILVQSLNDTQTKLLVVMRLLAKHFISPVSPDVTSYVIKNVVFHISETLQLKDFGNSTLIARIDDCLQFLRICVEKQNLPNYLNPERNLFQGKLLQENIVKRTMDAIDSITQNGESVLMFYLINRMKPEQIKQMYPRIAKLKASLEGGNIAEMFAEKKVNAMTLTDLIDLHVHNDTCSTEFMIFVNELWYVYRPYVLKYGFISLVEDIRKLRPKHKADIGIDGRCEEIVDGGVINETGYNNEINRADYHTGKMRQISEKPGAMTDDQEWSDGSEGTSGNITSDQNSEYMPGTYPVIDQQQNSFAKDTYKCVTAAVNSLLWTSMLVCKFIMLNLFQLTHMVCLIFMWYSMRQNSHPEITFHIDVLGFTLLVVSGFSFIKRTASEMLNVIYMTILIAILRSFLSFSDPYTLYFHEMIVMLDPRQADASHYRRIVYDLDEDGYLNMERTYIV